MLRVSGARLTQNANVGRFLKAKPEGDISSVFSSLSKDKVGPLPKRFAAIKRDIVGDKLPLLHESWHDLIPALTTDIEEIKGSGNKVIPSISYHDCFTSASQEDSRLFQKIRHRGVCIVRNVFNRREALEFKEDIKKYIDGNPLTKAFPADNPQVYELYWSPAQVAARADPRMLQVQQFFVSLWHSSESPQPPEASPNINKTLIYADRLRIRQPGDATFALGPHVDGGGVERWEDLAYRRCYKDIFEGRWREFDPYDLKSRGRMDVNMNMYETAGGCSVFRAWQGWLSMSDTAPSEGTLRVLPLTKTAIAYWLLRPFFSPSPSSPQDLYNWTPNVDQLYLHGANPGRGHELSAELHPHLQLEHSLVSIPRVEPGDVVMWMGDLVHAVESVHKGTGDSSVMYIPAVPDTPLNREYIAVQKEAFLQGLPPPDFPGGIGESRHVGRAREDLIMTVGGKDAMTAMGF